MAEITTADQWFARYWCGCGNGDPGAVLRDYFAIFADQGEGEYPRFFIDLDLADAFRGRYGNDVLHLLGYLLDGAGLVAHSGSVISSAWLTPLGEAVRERAMKGEFGQGE